MASNLDGVEFKTVNNTSLGVTDRGNVGHIAPIKHNIDFINSSFQARVNQGRGGVVLGA